MERGKLDWHDVLAVVLTVAVAVGLCVLCERISNPYPPEPVETTDGTGDEPAR